MRISDWCSDVCSSDLVRVQDRDGEPLAAAHPYRVGMELRYFREVADEEPIPFCETVLHADDDLWVVDKPHFLPVVPAGRHVAETLLARLQRMSGNADLVPLHRIRSEEHTSDLQSLMRIWSAVFRFQNTKPQATNNIP